MAKKKEAKKKPSKSKKLKKLTMNDLKKVHGGYEVGSSFQGGTPSKKVLRDFGAAVSQPAVNISRISSMIKKTSGSR